MFANPSLAQYAEPQTTERFFVYRRKMLKVTLGPELHAKQGAMVAYQGNISFDHKGAGMKGYLKSKVTGEGMSLMKVSGQGEVFLADQAAHIYVIQLEGDGLSINGRNVLAFDPTLTWDIKKVEGVGFLSSGTGFFNVVLQGHGAVAIIQPGPAGGAGGAGAGRSRRHRRLDQRPDASRPAARPGSRRSSAGAAARPCSSPSRARVTSSSSRVRCRPVIHGDLLQHNRPKPSHERMVNQSSKMLKVTMGPDLLARKGAMVAHEGYMEFGHEGAGLSRYLKQWATGEGVPLMRCNGQGDLYLGAHGADIVCFYLDNDEISVNSPNVVGFDAHMNWDVPRSGAPACSPAASST